jgi:hypothetical protein
MSVQKLLLSIPLALAVACGGGGGGGSSSSSPSVTLSSTTDGGLTFVTQGTTSFNGSEGTSVSSSTTGMTLLQSDTNKDLLIAASTGSTNSPEFLLALQGDQPTGANLSGVFNAAIFGEQSGDKAAIQVLIDFATPTEPSVALQGLSATSTDLSGEITDLNNADDFSIDDDGTVTWGDYTGKTTEDGDKFLLSHNSDSIMILASKREAVSAISNSSLTAGLFAQNLDNNGDILSGQVSVSISNSNLSITFGTEDIASSGDTIDSDLIPSRDFGYVAGSSNSEIEIYEDNTTNIVEQGFVSDEFVVIINPITTRAPYIIIAPL